MTLQNIQNARVNVDDTGAIAISTSAPINLGNNNSFIRTWNGRMYRTLLFNGVLSIARRQQYAQAAGLVA